MCFQFVTFGYYAKCDQGRDSGRYCCHPSKTIHWCGVSRCNDVDDTKVYAQSIWVPSPCERCRETISYDDYWDAHGGGGDLAPTEPAKAPLITIGHGCFPMGVLMLDRHLPRERLPTDRPPRGHPGEADTSNEDLPRAQADDWFIPYVRLPYDRPVAYNEIIPRERPQTTQGRGPHSDAANSSSRALTRTSRGLTRIPGSRRRSGTGRNRGSGNASQSSSDTSPYSRNAGSGNASRRSRRESSTVFGLTRSSLHGIGRLQRVFWDYPEDYAP